MALDRNKGITKAQIKAAISDGKGEMTRRYMDGLAKPRHDKMEKIARLLGVSASWLEHGDAEVAGVAQPAQQELAGTLSALAIDVAKRWEALSDERREWFRDLIFTVSYVEERFPEMRKGAPRGANYPLWEVHTKAAFDQLPLFTDLPKPKKAAKGM